MYFDERENLDLFNISELKNINKDYNITIDNLNINNFRNDMLFSLEEGFNKGNLFKDIYKPYKNYIYKVVVNNEKDHLLLLIQELTFKIKDLSLYLDLHPEDTKMYDEFKNTIIELNKYKEMYETKYNSLCLFSTLKYDSYNWVNGPWPWDRGGNSNV